MQKHLNGEYSSNLQYKDKNIYILGQNNTVRCFPFPTFSFSSPFTDLLAVLTTFTTKATEWT